MVLQWPLRHRFRRPRFQPGVTFESQRSEELAAIVEEIYVGQSGRASRSAADSHSLSPSGDPDSGLSARDEINLLGNHLKPDSMKLNISEIERSN